MASSESGVVKIYIAAKYQKRRELRHLAWRLSDLGHVITSRWLHEGEEDKAPQQSALDDVEDVIHADCLVFIGEPQGSQNRGGGRWFEFGLAYGVGKRCIVVLNVENFPDVGDRSHLPSGHESVFSTLPNVQIVRDENELIEILK